jgi:hypothetical protein
MGLPYSTTPPYSFAGPSRSAALPPSLHIALRELAHRLAARWRLRRQVRRG